MHKRKNYTGGAAVGSIALLAILVAVSFVPAFSIGSINFKRVDILSDFRPTRSEIVKTGISSEKSLDTSFLADAPSEIAVVRPDSSDSIRYVVPNIADTIGRVAIEDFSADGQMMARFYDALINEAPTRTVRIAACGDSFIESDILTADLREQLQAEYGGRGVGFVPFSTPLSGYRSTIKHTWNNWTTYNLLKKKSVPIAEREEFFISGMTSIPLAGAMSRYVNTSFRPHLNEVNSAQLIFTNRGQSDISVSINGGTAKIYSPITDTIPDRITLLDSIKSLTVRITKPEGFIGYGVVLEDTTGVSVHNFSVRSSSGLPLFGTSERVNLAINAMENYDLIILQYGLNVMEARVNDYSYYGEQLKRIIAYLQSNFPQSAILVLGVSDRCIVEGGIPVSMSVADAMEKAQRDAAVACGVAFWSIRKAMQTKGGMVGFVKNRWAARDYTHIGHSGGREIARVLTDYIKAATEGIKN